MNIDLLASIELTASAAIAISALATGFGKQTHERVRIAIWLAAWYAVVILMGTSGVLTYPHGLGAPGLGVAVVAPLVALVVVVLRSASLRQALREIPLPVLVGVHAIRLLGDFFLVLYAQGRLPAPFAPLAGWGDMITGLIAIPLTWWLVRGKTVAPPLLWLWNSFGMLDLVTAIGLGAVSAPGPIQLITASPGTTMMTTLPWLIIPAFIVPLLAATHLAIYYRLMVRVPPASEVAESFFGYRTNRKR